MDATVERRSDQLTDWNADEKLSKDLRAIAGTLSPGEARFMVDAYYQMQENRKRTANQVRSQEKSSEPHAVIQWLCDRNQMLEGQVKLALDHYSRTDPLGAWARSNKGVGPVIAAGLLAHIDFDRAPTAGHIWNFAGLNPGVKWMSSKATETLVRGMVSDFKSVTMVEIEAIAKELGRNPDKLADLAKKGAGYSGNDLCKGAARRPWNADLKTLCWKLGESFVKVSGYDDAFYGQLYAQRKLQETRKNEAGDFSDQAAQRVGEVGKNTEAHAWYSGRVTLEAAQQYREDLAAGKAGAIVKKGEGGCGSPMLPPAHIHSRAKRAAVKMFLSHFHEVGYWIRKKTKAPRPYAIEHLGHAHQIDPPNTNCVDGWVS